MAFTDQELIELNQKGFIPGPNEEEADFQKRVEYCKNLKANFASQLGQQLPLDLATMPKEIEDPVNAVTKKLFDFVLDWVPVVFSNYRMAFWHGGCAWIYQMTQDTPTAAFFQLRRTFATSPRYLGIYDREEIVEHESAHVGRMMFQDPKFEEVLAYRTSKSNFRKFFGPIIQAPRECLLFVMVMFLIIIGQVLVALYGSSDNPWNQSLFWLKIVAIGIVLVGIWRVYRRQKQLDKCISTLTSTLGSIQKGDAVTYRLQDDEIIAFGKMSRDEIRTYAEEQAPHTLRWRMIYHAYFQ